jgi:hypothetical protein
MSWLTEYTNKDESYWVARVQTLVSENTVPREDGHGTTDVSKWLHKLVDEVINELPPREGYDGNMRSAAILSQVLGLWYVRLHLAKLSDPHRPAQVAQEVYKSWLTWSHAMFNNIIDASRDTTFFPGQGWSHPFDPRVERGEFL